MPERKNVRKFDSSSVQGEGSYVTLSRLTVQERLDAMNAGDANTFEMGIELLKDHVLEWNWVDDEGKPLPQVPDSPEVLHAITLDEADFLGRCMMGTEEEAKN